MQKEFETAIKVAGKVASHWLPLKIQYDHTPGAVVSIAMNGVPEYIHAFGYSDVEGNIEMKKNTQFRVASMSKMFTAVAVMQLQEKNLLRLDDTVTSYLPWFTGTQGKTDLANVTIRQLLSHGSGLFRDGTHKHWLTDIFPTELCGTISTKSIVFENGITFKYSNHGYAVLGAIIENVTQQTYAEYVTEHIINKLRLKNTLPDLPTKRPEKLAYGYSRYLPDQPLQTKEPDSATYAYAPATGFISDVKDLAIFLASLHLDSKKSVLSRESKKVMMQIHGITEDEEMYGLGLALDKDSGRLTYGHSGGFTGFSTNAITEPNDNLQVIVLTNTISNTAWAVSNNLMGLIYKLKSMKEVTYIENEPYSGTYRSRWGDVTVVSLGKNLVDFGSGAANPAKAWSVMEPTKNHSFRNTEKSGFGSPGEEIRFTNIKNGKAQKMSNDGMVWERIF